jgi:hypothetical protein
MRTIENRITNARLGLMCCAVGAVGLIYSAISAKLTIGYSFPRSVLVLSLLGDAYGACFFLWRLKRLRKEQSAKQSDLWKSN